MREKKEKKNDVPTMDGHALSMLTAINARSHVHLIIGSNPLAASRCGQSLAAGASPILLAPGTAELHYALQRRVDDGEVRRLEKEFEEEDLFTLGREEVGRVVDAVFVTTGPRDPLSMTFPRSPFPLPPPPYDELSRPLINT